MTYKGKHYNHVFYVGTIYTLFLYLCKFTLEQIKDTLFIFAYGIPKEVAERIEHGIHMDEKNAKQTIIPFFAKHYHLQWIVMLYYWLFKVPKFEGNETLYAQDHLFLAGFICSKPYILMEDGPGYIQTNVINGRLAECQRMRSRPSYPIRRLLYGYNYLMSFGDNPNCKGLVLTQVDSSGHLKEKPIEYVNLHDLWEQADEQKQKYILEVFDLRGKDVEQLSSRPLIFFTQPLCVDFESLSMEEHISITKRILGNYNPHEVIIKVHPRDVIDYRKLFPGVFVFDKKIPSQLIDLLGIKFKKAVTTFSTAACAFNYDIDIDWYGTEVNEKLIKFVGHIKAPKGAVQRFLE